MPGRGGHGEPPVQGPFNISGCADSAMNDSSGILPASGLTLAGAERRVGRDTSSSTLILTILYPVA